MRGQRALDERFLQRVRDALLRRVCGAQHVRFAAVIGRAEAFAFDACRERGLLHGVQKRDQKHDRNGAAGQQTDVVDRGANLGVHDRFALRKNAVNRRDVGSKAIDELLAVALEGVGCSPATA
jgi:hypothetical protein